ncbi:MAG: hypothetical protein R6V31_04480 [Halohasta sp.]
MVLGPTLFAVVVWGAVGSVLAAFAYLLGLLVDRRRTAQSR